MNIDKILQTLKDNGFPNCEYANGMIKVYYSSGPSIHEEVGKILKKCGYKSSFSTSGLQTKIMDNTQNINPAP